jgi:hypothetical protein
MSDALIDSEIADQLHGDLFVKRFTASDSTGVLGDLEKAPCFGESSKSGSNGLFVQPRWASDDASWVGEQLSTPWFEWVSH